MPVKQETARCPLGDLGGSRVGQGSGAAAQAHFEAHWQHRRCELFPDAFRSAHPFDVEIPVEHREQQLHLEQGENAAGKHKCADPNQMECAPIRRARRRVRRANAGAGRLGVLRSDQDRTLPDARSTNTRVPSGTSKSPTTVVTSETESTEERRPSERRRARLGGERTTRGDKFAGPLDVGGYVRCCKEPKGYPPQFHHRLQAVAQLMDCPAQRVRGRVFAREQHGHEISENHVVGKRPAFVIACRQHGLFDVLLLLGSAGLGREARSLGDYQFAEPHS